MVTSRLFWILAFVVAAADLISKAVVFSWLEELGGPYTVIDGFFRLVRVMNTGGAWGIGQGNAEIFAIVRFAAIPIILAFLITTRTKSWLFPAGLGMVFGGAIGNLWDTVMLGGVRDFLEFDLQFAVFPSFNIADSGITVGATLVVVHFLFFDRVTRTKPEVESTRA